MSNDPEYAALYAAVCANPDDNTPRLVLADWLDEHKEPHRAAYIRAQIGLAQARESDPHAAAVFDFFTHRDAPDGWPKYGDYAAVSPAVGQMREFRKQEERYEERARKRWRAALPRRVTGFVREFERGFPLLIDLSDAGRYAARAKKEPPEPLPGYEFYLNSPSEEELTALLASDRFDSARGVRGFGMNSVEFVRKLGKLPAARNFRRVSFITSFANTTEIIAALAAEPNWAALTDLGIYSETVEAELPRGFFKAKHLQGLERLGLGLGDAGEDQYRALARMPWSRLRALDVYNCQSAGAVGQGLAAGEFPELRELNLMANRLGNAGARALAKCKKLKRLATLNLTYNDITDGNALAELITGPTFPVLAGLNLKGNKCRALDAKALAAVGRGPTLQLLSLGNCGLSSKTAAALAAAPALAGLVCLDLGDNNFGDRGAKALFGGARWDRLKWLSLNGNEITADGIEELVAWPGLANLTFLNLRDNPIGLDGAKALAGCKALKKCRLALSFDERNLPADGLKLLQEAFGKNVGRV